MKLLSKNEFFQTVLYKMIRAKMDAFDGDCTLKRSNMKVGKEIVNAQFSFIIQRKKMLKSWKKSCGSPNVFYVIKYEIIYIEFLNNGKNQILF